MHGFREYKIYSSVEEFILEELIARFYLLLPFRAGIGS